MNLQERVALAVEAKARDITEEREAGLRLLEENKINLLHFVSEKLGADFFSEVKWSFMEDEVKIVIKYDEDHRFFLYSNEEWDYLAITHGGSVLHRTIAGSTVEERVAQALLFIAYATRSGGNIQADLKRYIG